MNILLAVATLVGYIFIITMYSMKIIKFLRLPTHLRAEIYPFIPTERYSSNKFYFKYPERLIKPQRKHLFRRILFLLKEYVFLGEYFHQDKRYWLALHPWHTGFMLIITFHIFSFFGALAMVGGIPVAPNSPFGMGITLYYLSLYLGVMSFVTGLFGSIGILVLRLADKKLRDYATPLNYFTYVFLLAVFLSGLYSWYFVDPAFNEYREFWKGLITLQPTHVEPATAIHVLLFALLLIYLPFTRSLHYITRLFAFFLIRWDDEPNMRGSLLEKKIQNLLNQRVSWSGPHIPKGVTWRDIAAEAIHQGEKGKTL
jgi:nitrate reductase gamma subunit